MNTRPELTPDYTLKSGLSVLIFSPVEIRIADSQVPQYPIEQQLLQVPLINRCQVVRHPVRPAVAVRPDRAGLEHELTISARFVETSSVACEVLYYIKDVPAALSRMSELGAKCLVTYYQSGACVLDEFFNDFRNVETKIIKAGDKSWKVVWWNSTHSRDGDPA